MCRVCLPLACGPLRAAMCVREHLSIVQAERARAGGLYRTSRRARCWTHHTAQMPRARVLLRRSIACRYERCSTHRGLRAATEMLHRWNPRHVIQIRETCASPAQKAFLSNRGRVVWRCAATGHGPLPICARFQRKHVERAARRACHARPGSPCVARRLSRTPLLP